MLQDLLLLLTFTAYLTDGARTVRVGVIEAEGFSQFQNSSSEGLSPQTSAANWRGFVPDVVRQLGSQLGFVPTFHRVSDNSYGEYNEPTKKWTGLIGQLIAGDFEFVAAPLTVTAQREAHVDFTHEVLDIGLTVLMKRMERLSPASRGYNFFLSVFDSGVWGSAVAAFLVTSFLLYLNDRYNPREALAKVSEHFAANTASASPLHQFTLLGSAFYVLSTGCFQGYQRAPRSLCGRCLSLFWWVFVCIFVATYTAGFLCALVASRGSQENAFAYMDARDQYRANPESMQPLTPLWVPGGSTEALMKKSSDPLLQFFYKQHTERRVTDTNVSRVTNIDRMVEIMMDSDYHYLGIVESPMADYQTRKSRCGLVAAGSLLIDRSYAFAFPEAVNGSLFNLVNAEILRMRESGFIREVYQKYFGGPHVPCDQAASPSLTSAAFGLAGEELARMFRDSLPISLKTFAGPVVLYFLSLLLSAAAAMMDVHVYTSLEKHRHGAQVLHNTAEAQEEPSFSALANSEEQRRQQQQQLPQVSPPQPGGSNIEI